MFFWLIMQSSPTSVCWNEQKKRRPITALFQIWKVHFGPWEILRETPVKIRKVSWKGKTLHFLAQTTWLEATLTILLKKIASQVKFAERKSALL